MKTYLLILGVESGDEVCVYIKANSIKYELRTTRERLTNKDFDHVYQDKQIGDTVIVDGAEIRFDYTFEFKGEI